MRYIFRHECILCISYIYRKNILLCTQCVSVFYVFTKPQIVKMKVGNFSYGKIILNSFLFWGGWIIIPFIMEIVPAIGSVFLLIRRNLRHKIHKKNLRFIQRLRL